MIVSKLKWKLNFQSTLPILNVLESLVTPGFILKFSNKEQILIWNANNGDIFKLFEFQTVIYFQQHIHGKLYNHQICSFIGHVRSECQI